MSTKNINYIISKEISERINMLKFFLSIMVVFIHSYSTGNNFASGMLSFQTPLWLDNFKWIISNSISRCAVPAFFLIASVLLYRKQFSWKVNIKRKLKTLGIPFVILHIVWIGAFFVAQNLSFTSDFFSDADNIIRNWGCVEWCDAFLGFKDQYPFLYPLWFIRDLIVLNFLAKVIWYFIDRVPNAMFLISLVLWILVDSTGIFCLDIQGICFWIFGGVLVKKDIKLDRIDKVPLSLLTAMYVLSESLDLLTRSLQIHLYIHRVSLIYGVIFWFSLTRLLVNSRIKQKLLTLSTYSFSIYIFHELTLTVMQKICGKIFSTDVLSQVLQYIFLPIVVITFCIGISVCLKKLLPQMYSLLVGGRG